MNIRQKWHRSGPKSAISERRIELDTIMSNILSRFIDMTSLFKAEDEHRIEMTRIKVERRS